MTHIVDFANHCKNCEHKNLKEEDMPCFDCLREPVNENSIAPKFYKGPVVGPKRENGYESIRKLDDYLYYVEYNNLDYSYANYYYSEKGYFGDAPGGCTSIAKGKYFGRNFDFPYDHRCSFVVKTPARGKKLAVLGVAGAISDLTEEIVSSGAYNPMYRVVPFQLQDGINECGLCVSTNVVPLDKGKNITIPARRQSTDLICASALIRYILENFASARDAVKYLKNYVAIYFAKALHEMGYEQHWLISDMSNTYILEVSKNQFDIIDAYSNPYITNFHIGGVRFNSDGTVYTPATQDWDHNARITNRITPLGSGLERYNYVVQHIDQVETKLSMQSLLKALRYTRAYPTSDDISDPFWYTEFVGIEGLDVTSFPEEYSDVVRRAGSAFLNRSRDTGKTWQTVHSSVYNMASKTLYIHSQEKDKEYEFTLEDN